MLFDLIITLTTDFGLRDPSVGSVKGVILSIHEMQPLSDVAHQSAGPARFALEMNAGWFGSNNVRAGDTIKGLEKAPKPR